MRSSAGALIVELSKSLTEFQDLIDTGSIEDLEAEANRLETAIKGLDKPVTVGGQKLEGMGVSASVASQELTELETKLNRVRSALAQRVDTRPEQGAFDFAAIKAAIKEAEKPPKNTPLTSAQKRGIATAADIFQQQTRALAILKEESDLGKKLLENDFARADELEKINKLEGINAKRRKEIVDITNKAFDAQKGSIIGQALGQDAIKAKELAEAQREAVQPLERQKELLEAKLNGTEKEIVLKHQVEDIMNSVDGLNEKDVKDKVRAVAALKDQVTESERLQKIYDSIGQTISTGIVNSLMEAKSVSEALGGVLNNIARQMMQLGINTLLKSTGIGIFANLPGFANGGRPPVGRPSVVGERGPELFVPDRAGTIVPNSALGGAGISPNVVVNVDASGSSVQGDEGSSRQLGALIGAAVQGEIIKQQRPGGLLSR